MAEVGRFLASWFLLFLFRLSCSKANYSLNGTVYYTAGYVVCMQLARRIVSFQNISSASPKKKAKAEKLMLFRTTQRFSDLLLLF